MAPSYTTEPTEYFFLGSFKAPRIWTGLWQLSSNAWGSATVSKVRQGMSRHVELGYTAFDMADHYGSAEIIFGQFRESSPSPEKILGATKWCVFNPVDPTRAVVEAVVQERMKRMRTTRIDLLQFHWGDYSDKGYIVALEIMRDLQTEGLIAAIGLCNFDAIRTDEICTLLGPGVIVSNQVQFSIIDTRPLHGMADVCERHNLKLLTYGTLCGGFLADKWLNEPEPDLYSSQLTPSQRKYLDIIVKAWGNWMLFQALLGVLRVIGDRHGGLSIANVATRWVLDHSFVGAVLIGKHLLYLPTSNELTSYIGTRLGVSEHPDDNHKVFGFNLTEKDNFDIESVVQHSNGRRMITTIGDCGAEYR